MRWRPRDPLTFAAGAVFALVLVACFVVEPLLEILLGRTPNDLFPYAVASSTVGLPKPVGPWTWVPALPFAGDVGPETPRTLFVLGSDSSLGRDELLRLLAGGRASLEVAIGAAALAVAAGGALGALAAWFGGVLDAAVSRLTELVMAFPLLLLIIALGQTVADRLDVLRLGSFVPQGVPALALVVAAFTWFYPARVVRAEVLSLKSREFIEAARVTGAGELRIVRTHVLPHLAGPLVVWGTLIVATNMILEAAVSFLNLGVRPPTPTLGEPALVELGDAALVQPDGRQDAADGVGLLAADRGRLRHRPLARAARRGPAAEAPGGGRGVTRYLLRRLASGVGADPAADLPHLRRLLPDPDEPGLPARRLRPAQPDVAGRVRRRRAPDGARPAVPRPVRRLRLAARAARLADRLPRLRDAGDGRVRDLHAGDALDRRGRRGAARPARAAARRDLGACGRTGCSTAGS